jgi:RNA polymerase sigma factor (sigma-70 family)
MGLAGVPASVSDAQRGEVTVDMPRLLAASSGSFEEVYASELQAVTRLAFLLVRSQAVAEELAQDAFLRLFERFHVVENPAGFLRTVVVRLCLTWQRRDQMEHRLIRQVGIDRPAEVSEIDETWEALGRLQPERRVVLVLRFYEQLPHREIAALLGCPTATVRSRTRRALKDLREELDRCTGRDTAD